MVKRDQPSKGELVQIGGMPCIEGLRFRRLSDRPDFAELARVIQRSRDAARYELVETPEDLESDFKHLQNCDPKKDMLRVEIDGSLVGFCRTEWRRKEDGTRVYQHQAHLVPECGRRGLLRALVRLNEARLREIAKGHPKNCRKFIEAQSSYLPNHWKTLLEQEGYKASRHVLLMVRPDYRGIPDAPLPQGLEIRPYRKQHLREIFRAAGESFRDEPNFTQEMWNEDGMRMFQEWRIFNPKLWQIAWDGSKVAGGSINMIDDAENEKYDRNWGYLMVIFVRRPYRHKGLASALIASSLEVLKKAGVSQAALGVDLENPSGALRLYERMGFREKDHYVRYRKPMD